MAVSRPAAWDSVQGALPRPQSHRPVQVACSRPAPVSPGSPGSGSFSACCTRYASVMPPIVPARVRIPPAVSVVPVTTTPGEQAGPHPALVGRKVTLRPGRPGRGAEAAGDPGRAVRIALVGRTRSGRGDRGGTARRRRRGAAGSGDRRAGRRRHPVPRGERSDVPARRDRHLPEAAGSRARARGPRRSAC